MPDLDQEALTRAHVAVENVLIQRRDDRISVLGPANGLVVKESDGTESSVMRLGTRDALQIGIKAYLEALDKPDRLG